MTQVSKLLLIAASALLSACATAGPINISCPGFDDPNPKLAFRKRLPPTRLERQIKGETVIAPLRPAPPDKNNPLQAAFEEAMLLASTKGVAPGETLNFILLSGGGQWGAFGAGFFSTLQDTHGPNRIPRIDAVTGVSTGALQALFLAVDKPHYYGRLLSAYSPKTESEIVDRHPQPQAAVRGSIAGLKPLRARIEHRLCEGEGNCLVEELKTLQIPVLIGFIEAESGDFYFVDAVKLARIEDRPTAIQCLTGAALASAAMPVFFQQIRINDKTYYDGGVRQSVFAASVAEATASATFARRTRFGPEAKPIHLFAVRNGPTTVRPDAKPNAAADALANALRAEAIVVNQLEVGSIAALRLEYPTGPISVVTADRWNLAPQNGQPGGQCEKPDKVMFHPPFMKCLRHFGAAKAAVKKPWIELDSLTSLAGAPGP